MLCGELLSSSETLPCVLLFPMDRFILPCESTQTQAQSTNPVSNHLREQQKVAFLGARLLSKSYAQHHKQVFRGCQESERASPQSSSACNSWSWFCLFFFFSLSLLIFSSQ